MLDNDKCKEPFGSQKQLKSDGKNKTEIYTRKVKKDEGQETKHVAISFDVL